MPVRLFVGNLSYDATEVELRELFSAVGPLTFVRVATDRETGRPRGFAFVEYADRAHAEEAIRRFNNQIFKGRPMAVNEARSRDEAPPPRTSSPRPPSFRPSPSWAPPDDQPPERRPARSVPSKNFGPDALPAHKRRRKEAERAPRPSVTARRSRLLEQEDLDSPYEFRGDNFAEGLDGQDEEE
jgi:RNA recognition motif-containing protein